MWKAAGGHLTTIEALAHAAQDADVEGVTLLGGEPFEQAKALAEFARLIQLHGMSVMTFSGYTYDALTTMSHGDSGVADLLNRTDLLVDGPYLAESPDIMRPWVGSTNQQFRFLTDRYRALADSLHALPDRIEIRVDAMGRAAVNGWASVDALDELLTDLGTPIKRGSIR